MRLSFHNSKRCLRTPLKCWLFEKISFHHYFHLVYEFGFLSTIRLEKEAYVKHAFCLEAKFSKTDVFPSKYVIFKDKILKLYY
jgi:hypothetical protein